MTLPSRTAPANANIAGKAAMNHTNASNKLKICGQKPLWTILPCYACAVHLLCQRKVLDRLVVLEVFRLYSRFSGIFLKVFAKFVLIFNRETSSSLDLRTKSRVPICKAARDNKKPALQPGIWLGFLDVKRNANLTCFKQIVTINQLHNGKCKLMVWIMNIRLDLRNAKAYGSGGTVWSRV